MEVGKIGLEGYRSSELWNCLETIKYWLNFESKRIIWGKAVTIRNWSWISQWLTIYYKPPRKLWIIDKN